MSVVGNLGGESVGSMENSQACYLGVWMHAPHPSLPQKILEAFRPYCQLAFFGNKDYVAIGSFKSK